MHQAPPVARDAATLVEVDLDALDAARGGLGPCPDEREQYRRDSAATTSAFHSLENASLGERLWPRSRVRRRFEQAYRKVKASSAREAACLASSSLVE